MSLGRWRKALERNGMEVLGEGYYHSMDFWVDSPVTSHLKAKAVAFVQSVSKMAKRNVRWPNSYTSPYMYSFSRRRKG